MFSCRDTKHVPRLQDSPPIFFCDSQMEKLGASLASHPRPSLGDRRRRKSSPQRGRNGKAGARAVAKAQWAKAAIYYFCHCYGHTPSDMMYRTHGQEKLIHAGMKARSGLESYRDWRRTYNLENNEAHMTLPRMSALMYLTSPICRASERWR